MCHPGAPCQAGTLAEAPEVSLCWVQQPLWQHSGDHRVMSQNPKPGRKTKPAASGDSQPKIHQDGVCGVKCCTCGLSWGHRRKQCWMGINQTGSHPNMHGCVCHLHLLLLQHTVLSGSAPPSPGTTQATCYATTNAHVLTSQGYKAHASPIGRSGKRAYHRWDNMHACTCTDRPYTYL